MSKSLSKLPSGSRLQRVFDCPASDVLPDYSQHDSTVHSKPGSFRHDAVENAAIKGLSITVDGVDYSPLLARLGSKFESETCYAWNIVTQKGRSLGTKDREYSGADENESCSTIDYLIVHDDYFELIDLKSGYIQIEPDTWQLKQPMLAIADHLGMSKGIAIIAQPDRDKVLQLKEQHYDAMMFDIVKVDLKNNWDNYLDQTAEVSEILRMGLQPKVNPSPGTCHFCPAQLSCPDRSEAFAMITGDNTAMTNTTLLDAIVKLGKIEQALPKLKKYLLAETIARGGEVEDDTHKIYVANTKRRYITDEAKALAAIPFEQLDKIAPRRIKLSLADKQGVDLSEFIEVKETQSLKVKTVK